ncbi:MAG: efflux RND transporter periplasmic adaptor subunit [Desulfovibrionaceae bacterium]|nr:efflux RND transporter periplasmic adaptor subunit [Desulfovibrionaceae bacterium]
MRKIIVSHLLVVLAALTLAACGPDAPRKGESAPPYTPLSTAMVERVAMPRLHDAVGTVKAKTDTRVEALVTGRVLKVLVRPGDTVNAGDELVVLDNQASQARLEQSRQARSSATSLTGQARDALAAARAAHAKAESTYRRMHTLFGQKVVTAEELEKAEAAYLQAKAGLGQAEQGVAAAEARVREASKVVEEAEIGLGYTTIKAQESGEVAKRLVEPGDLAFPGKELLTLQTGGSLQLVAMVRESLISRVALHDRLTVEVAALGNESLTGEVVEIEPLADPVTRSFLVKVRLPEAPGLYPGMFGRLMVPLGSEEVVLAPEAAVTRVGQLETVMVETDNGWHPAYVRTGKSHDGKVEILSGLSGGETLGLGIAADGGGE